MMSTVAAYWPDKVGLKYCGLEYHLQFCIELAISLA